MESSGPKSSAPAPTGALPNIVRALGHRNYRLFFGGQLVSLVGTFLTQMATAWLVYRLTHSAWILGVVGFSAQIPMFFLAPFAGVWVDRLNRQKLLVVTQTLAMCQSFALAYLALRHTINVPEIIALSLFQGLINALDMPARQAFLVEMVEDRRDLANAIALNSTMVHLSRPLGYALAALLIHTVGEGWCFLLDGGSYLAVIVALIAMRIKPRPRIPVRSVLADLVEGVRYVWGFTPIRTLLMMLALLSLTGIPAFITLLPIFAGHFGGQQHGAIALGALNVATGVGALSGAVYLASRRTVVGLGRVIAWAATLYGAALIGFSLSNHLWLSLPLAALAGLGMIVNFASANTLLQTLSDEDKRGRVMSFFTVAFIGMTPWGNLLAGKLAAKIGDHTAGGEWMGAEYTLLLMGCICLLGALFFAINLPALRKIVRPIYVKKGILPPVASGLQAAAHMESSGG